MSSVGQALGTVAGGAIAYFSGYPGFMAPGASLGGAVGAYIDPPKGPNIVGPRLSDLSVQTSTYGAAIPRTYGTIAQFGNVFWLENNQLKEVAHKKKSSGGKGGGGSSTKTTTYTYQATFAVGICAGPIAGVRRIWIGSKLVYDVGADSLEATVATQSAKAKFRLYLGTDTQEPDPRMEATLGVGNVPAYRGLAYLVFEDYDLVDHGNSLLGAQVKVEVVHNLSETWELDSTFTSPVLDDTTYDCSNYAFDGQMLTAVGIVGGLVSVYRIALGGVSTYVGSFNAPFANPVEAGRGDDGTVFFSGYLDDTAIRVRPDGTVEEFYRPRSGALYWKFASSMTSPYTVCYYRSNGVYTVYVIHNTYQLIGEELHPFYEQFTASAKVKCVVVHGDRAWLVHPNTIDVWDLRSLTLVDSWPYADNPSASVWSAIWINDNELLIHHLNEMVRATPDGPTVWWGSVASYDSVMGPGVVAVWHDEGGSGDTVRVYKVTVDTSSITTLGAVVKAEALQSGILENADIDTSDLTDIVPGFHVSTTASIRSAIEPLQAAWPFDVVQDGYVVRAVRRGNASMATIAEADLGAVSSGAAPGPRLSVTREMDTQLPWRVSLKYLDLSREYDIGEQYAERPETNAVNVLALDIPIALDGETAATMAEVLLAERWYRRAGYAFSLPPTWRHLQPADVVTVLADGASHEILLEALHYQPDGRIECSGVANGAAIYTSYALGGTATSGGQTIGLTGPTRALLLDLPCITGDMNTPGFALAMHGYYSGWRGGVLIRSDDGGASYVDVAAISAPGSTVGSTSTALPGWPSPGMMDKSHVLNVRMASGTLASVSELAMLNGANHFAIGAHERWEIVSVQNCDLQVDGSYNLYDMRRGLFGTEWAMGTHAAGDYVVLLTHDEASFIESSSAMIGGARAYKAVTIGADAALALPFSFAYAGVNLEPLSPVYLNGHRHPTTNDWTLSWLRRTRVNGDWRDYVDVELGETWYSFEVEIYSSNTYATLKRTITGLATETATYTSAQQVADFGSNQSTLYVKVYQLSTLVGRGYPLTASITR